MESRVNEHLPLARKIALEFPNIPGVPLAEREMAAQEALARAARSFDPAKGDFTAYAAVAMRNALRDLYEIQLRHYRHHVYSLDQPETTHSSDASASAEGVPDNNGKHLPDIAALIESNRRLEEAMSGLSPRMRSVADGIRDGKSYSEIGATLGISKQAVQKIAHATINALKEKLETMGFSGVDTVGLLKSATWEPRHHEQSPNQSSSG